MQFVYRKVLELEGSEKVGSKQCVVKRFIRAQGKKKYRNGWWPGGGSNANAYSIIER